MWVRMSLIHIFVDKITLVSPIAGTHLAFCLGLFVVIAVLT